MSLQLSPETKVICQYLLPQIQLTWCQINLLSKTKKYFPHIISYRYFLDFNYIDPFEEAVYYLGQIKKLECSTAQKKLFYLTNIVPFDPA